MRTIAQKRPIGFYGLLSKKTVRVAVLLCSLLLINTAINTLVIVLSSKWHLADIGLCAVNVCF